MSDLKSQLAVLKFGGSVVTKTQDFSPVATIIREYLQHYERLAVVVSALQGMTDALLAQAHEISPNPPRRELDMLVSVGERISASLMCIALERVGICAQSFTGSQAGILTCEEHTQAKIRDVVPDRLQRALQQLSVVIIAGFQGVSALKKEITTLGRGGSDTSAVALGIALRASRVVFFKDVGKLYDQDPKQHSHAQAYDYCSYEQAMELMDVPHFMLHPRAVQLAKVNSLPLHLTALHLPMSTGTLISSSRALTDKEDFSQPGVYEGLDGQDLFSQAVS